MDPTLYRRPVTTTEREFATERIQRSMQAHVIDAGESAGRLAHLAQVRTVGELAAVIDDLPDLGDLRARNATGLQPTVAAPSTAVMPTWTPGDVPPPRRSRLPLTSPGREDAPPPDLPPGPYGAQFSDADPRVLSHRVVTTVVPTAWGPSWQTTIVAQTNRFAVASLVLGLVGLFCGVFAPVGIVTGHIARSQIRKSDLALRSGTVAAVGEQPQTGHGLALAGLIVSYCVSALYLLLIALIIVEAIRGA